ncbi:hypothetical protein [Dactylosporangium sp. NPDC006015]|uniref:hypothetical protein n=1 Tax=Dactylosporangium sp. NPDC006015 TaxID=3154576 RepID=UPI0033B22CE8
MPPVVRWTERRSSQTFQRRIVGEAFVSPMRGCLLRLLCALFVGGHPDVTKVRDRFPGDADEVRKIATGKQQHVIENTCRYLKLVRAVAVVPRHVGQGQQIQRGLDIPRIELAHDPRAPFPATLITADRHATSPALRLRRSSLP